MLLAPNCTEANKCLTSHPVICPINTTLIEMVSWKSHLRGRRSARASQCGPQPGCLHRASPANEDGHCKSPTGCNSSLFSLTAYYCPHLCIDFPFLLFPLGFLLYNEVFSSPPPPLETQSMAAVNPFLEVT